MQWQLIYKAKRMAHWNVDFDAPTGEFEFKQTADPASTVETLDILLADETVTSIHLYPVAAEVVSQ